MLKSYENLKNLCNLSGIAMVMPFSSDISTKENPYALSYGGDHLNMVKKYFAEGYEAGVKVFCLHRPFGETSHLADNPGGMELDAGFQLTNDLKWRYILDEYDEAREWMRINMPDAIVIDYLGTIEEDLGYAVNTGQYNELLKRLQLSVSRCLDHENVWIALDAATGGRYADGGVFDDFAKFLASLKEHQGNGIIVESLPGQANAWSWDYPSMVLDSFWTRSLVWSGYGEHLRCHPAHRRRRSNNVTMRFYSEYPNFRWLNGHSRSWVSTHSDWLKKYLTSCLYFDHTPMIEYQTFGKSVKEVRDKYIEYRAQYTEKFLDHNPHINFVPPQQ